MNQNSITPNKRYRCLLCGRDKFTRKSPHQCVGGFRKRRIRWAIVTDDFIHSFRVNDTGGCWIGD